MNKISKALKIASSKKSDLQNDNKDKKMKEMKSVDDVDCEKIPELTTATDLAAGRTTTGVEAVTIGTVTAPTTATITAAISTTTITKIKNENEPIKSTTNLPLQEENSLEHLRTFCDYLELVIANANNVLNKAYESNRQGDLTKRLQRCVRELMNLQKEMKTISETINSISMEIKAVKENTENHKIQLKQLKTKARRKRKVLEKEQNRNEIKNKNRNPKAKYKTMIPKRLNSPASITSESRQLGETALLPWIELTDTDWIEPKTTSPSSEHTHLMNTLQVPFTMSVARFKPITITKRRRNNCQKKGKQQQQRQDDNDDNDEQDEEKGVTIYLKQIETGKITSDTRFISGSTSATTVMDWTWPD